MAIIKKINKDLDINKDSKELANVIKAKPVKVKAEIDPKLNVKPEIKEGKVTSVVPKVKPTDIKQTAVNKRITAIIEEIKENISITYAGEEDMINHILIAMLCGGHVLIEGVPGIGKTTLAMALAKSLKLKFKRIQFTPDTTPSDITGFNMYNPKGGEFVFQEGAVFGNIVIADEINRTNPKVQAGLLEAMAEKQVSVDGKIHQLPEIFLVVATQNPIEQFGTYELPEAQLDRFFMKFVVSYLPEDLELGLLMKDVSMKRAGKKDYKITVTEKEIIKLMDIVKDVNVDEKHYKFIMDIIQATRTHNKVSTGISTRSAVQLVEGAKACAVINGRNFVTPDDIKNVIKPMFNHKLVLTDEAKIDEVDTHELLEEIVDSVIVPE